MASLGVEPRDVFPARPGSIFIGRRYLDTPLTQGERRATIGVSIGSFQNTCTALIGRRYTLNMAAPFEGPWADSLVRLPAPLAA